MDLQKDLKDKIEELEKILAQVNRELAAAPGGYIRVAYKHKCPQYYLLKDRSDRNGIYLNKNQTPVIQAILQRDYNKKLKRKLEHQLYILKKCLKEYSDEELGQVFETTPKARRGNISPKALTSAQFLENWKSLQYTPKEIDPQLPVLLTSSGIQVRSKSEICIAEIMIKLHIPHRYEASRQIGSKQFYPDFTCLNLRTRQEFIWEHFGLMDNQEYEENAVSKIKYYQRNGYIPGQNLIITFEDKKHPFTAAEAEEIVRAYLI